MTLRIFSLEDDIWSIAPEGRVDLPAARAIEDALLEMCDQLRSKFVVDFSAVPYIGSSGLKALLSGVRRARTLGGDVRLAAMSERVREVFDMAGFDQVFAIHPTAAEAAETFRRVEREGR